MKSNDTESPERYLDDVNSLRPGSTSSLLMKKENATKLYFLVATKGYKNYKQAVAADPEWKEAYQKELNKLETIGEFEVVEREEYMKPFPFIEVLTSETDNVTHKKKLKQFFSLVR